MNLDELRHFLIRANMPHANGTAKTVEQPDGSRTIEYAEGDFRMHDNFFGGEPYGGRLVIFHQDKPVFMEVYYGRAEDTDLTPDELYGFLREALQHPGEDNPYRGPAEYRKDDWVYKSSVTGDITDHHVEESILKDSKQVYSATIIGGLVDQNFQGAM